MSNSEETNVEPPSAPASRLKLGMAGAILIAIMASAAWYLSDFAASDPALQLQLALDKLDRPNDPIAWETARRLALKVKSANFRDPEFPGAADFIQGIVAARADKSDPDRQRRIAAAAKLLVDADRFGLDETRRPEWTFALGKSYVEIGRNTDARSLLEEAWISYPAGATETGLDLAGIELDDPAAESIKFTPAILDRVAAQADLADEDRRRVIALRAKFALRQGRLDEARTDLDRLDDGSNDPNVTLMRADLSLTEGRLEDARHALMPLAFPDVQNNPGPQVIAAAAYRLGGCDERRGDAMSAARAFSKAASAAPDSADGVAGALDAARLYQQAGRDEEALNLFRQAIESQTEGDRKPLAADRFRDAVRAGCEIWIKREAFEPAITLAKMTEPILGQIESLEWQARGCERSADRVESLWTKADESHRVELETERRQRWRQSGAAYRSLAAKVNDSGRASAALWTAANHFRNGHDFGAAYDSLTEVLDLRMDKIEAAALVRRGRASLDLGHPTEAADDFKAVLDQHPTDPEAFEARLLLGRCHLDAGDTAQAEATWRELLALKELTPDAAEWRNALFSLADLLYRRGIAALAKADLEPSNDATWAADAVLPLDEAISRFDEFLRRTPGDELVPEARILRSDAMRRRADLALQRAAVAETENLREADRREADRLLTEAVGEIRKAQDALAPLADRNRLPPLGVQLLKATFFDLGHAFAALGRDREAVIAYGGAVNRYPDDPRVVTAFLRMAECHRRLGRPDDARAAIEQARLALEQFPIDAPIGGASVLSRDEWESWLTRLNDGGIVAGTP